jgi:hypothetical protein
MTRRIRFSGDKPPSRLRFCRHAYGPFELLGLFSFGESAMAFQSEEQMQKNPALATITVSPARSRRASDKCDEHAAPHCLHRMQQNRPKADIRWVSRRTVNDVTDPSLESRNRGQKPLREPAADCCTAFRNAAGIRVHGSVRRASSIANRCLLKYILIGGDGPSRSPLDSG